MTDLLPILRQARACTVCSDALPLGPKPMLQASPASRILLIGQAPGRAAHLSGIPWSDKSGDRLRQWLGLTPAQFYDPTQIALLPMGLCYPGKGNSGDLAPRPECAPIWHPQVIPALSAVQMSIYIGHYAFTRYLGYRFPDLTSAVESHRLLLPTQVVLPHPSPRNGPWLQKHPWFESEVIPALRADIRRVLS